VTNRQHGERTRYVHGPDERNRPKSETGTGCRCEPCCQANRDYAQRNAQRRGWGLSPWVDDATASRVRVHLTALREAGLGLRAIEKRAGVSRSALREATEGRRMRPETAERLLALPLDVPLADGSLVDATETWEQVNALLRAGYTKVWIAEQIGQQRALQLRKTQVTVRHARMIGEVYRRFVGIPPPLRGTTICCASAGGVCTWPPTSTWFCVACGYALHQCPPGSTVNA
jgi:hypothetical protein